VTKIDGGLRSLFRERIPDFHWQSIETGGTGRGVPDSNYCCGGREGWIEYKVTAGWAVTLRPEQIGWLLRRSRAGGRVFVAVRRCCPAGPRRAASDELWLVRGSAAALLRTHGLRVLLAGTPQKAGGPSGVRPADELVGVWRGGPAAWPWPALRAALLGP